MKAKSILAILLLHVAGLQTAWAQKVTLYMTGNQVAEYSLLQLDSIAFSEGSSSGSGDTTDPSVTGDAFDITYTTATLVGYATSIRDNLSNDLRVGFIYCLEGTPSKNNGTQVTVNRNDIAEDGRYTATISNLLSDATYYFRSFVYQSGIWFYGKVKSFITESIQVNFTTGEATAITCFSAKVSGSVDVQTPYSSLTYGICYGTNIEPTTNDNVMTASSSDFTFQLRRLMGGTDYYYRPYAIVDGQTRYGSVRTFRTLDDNVVETGDIDEETLIVTSRLTIGGGAYSSLVLGVCYGMNELPTINDMTVTSNEVDDENNYTVKLVNPDFEIIYYRAFILIDGVPHYGMVKSITFESLVHIKKLIKKLQGTWEYQEATAADGTKVPKLTIDQIGSSINQHTSTDISFDRLTFTDSKLNGTDYTVEGNKLILKGTENSNTLQLVVKEVNEENLTLDVTASLLVTLKVTILYRKEGFDWVDLGLPSGTLWATCNVGASKPEEYGDYFSWGETTTKSIYNWSTYKWCNGSYDTMTKYCTRSDYGYNGFTDNLTELQPEDDAATANWGSGRQMPSLNQINELYNSSYTTTEWTQMNGVNGRKITSKSNGNSVFLPAAGFRRDTSLHNAGSNGYYWSCSLYASTHSAYSLNFDSDHIGWSNDSRFFSRSVRPVRVPSHPMWSFRGAESYLISDEDTTITIPATLDYEYTVSTPDWIVGQPVEEGYQLHLLDNDTGAGREGIVTFTSIVGSKVITFRQFGTKSVCGSYKATYVNAKEKAVTQDVTLAASDTRGMLILKGLHAKYDIPLIMKSDGTLRVEGSGLVEHNNTIGYLFTVLHCTDGTDFTTQGYYYDAPLTLTRTDNVLVPSFTFATTTINYKDMFEQDMTATVDGFTLKTYTYPTVSYFFEDQVLGQYTNLRLEKNK